MSVSRSLFRTKQNKIDFPVVLNFFYNIKVTNLVLSWSRKDCDGTWVEMLQLRPSKMKQGCRLANSCAFNPARKRPGHFLQCAFSHVALTGAEAILQTEENSALNTDTGIGYGKGFLDHSIYFPDKADLSSVFPSASSVLWISCASAVLSFFPKVEWTKYFI